MKYAFFVIGLIMSLVTNAQCDTCNLSEPADYCYTDSLFTGYCAAFIEDQATFQLVLGKKTKGIPIAEETDTKYFLELAANKKLKIRTKDLLFIQEATAQWAIAKMTLGYTLDDQGLGIKILEEGTGTIPEKGSTLKVHYTGYLADGTKFDSSVDRGRPIEFILGTGRVIKGWDQAFAQLKRGTKARILIPSELGYGPRGAGGGTIPPNATLIFEVELIE
ncbi:MAG: FKBP-type peptidyl-prolyl cis-trans isomerase [Bacteroidota bacterium]